MRASLIALCVLSLACRAGRDEHCGEHGCAKAHATYWNGTTGQIFGRVVEAGRPPACTDVCQLVTRLNASILYAASCQRPLTDDVWAKWTSVAGPIRGVVGICNEPRMMSPSGPGYLVKSQDRGDGSALFLAN